MYTAPRTFLVLLIASMLAVPRTSALTFLLSDTTIHSAYFLGQRYKASPGEFLAPYTKFPPAPKTGPRIELVQFLTPFAQLVRECALRVGEYSAQQAQIDQRGKEDTVLVIVKIRLTPTCLPVLLPNELMVGGSMDVQNLRPSSFWKDFNFRVFDNQLEREPRSVSGKGDSICGKYGGCSLIGATVILELPASEFSSQQATVEVTAPDGQPFHADFDLAPLR